MATEPTKPSVEALSSASARMVGAAQESVVQVQSGGRGSGAGVILSPDGLVMTNQHVVAGRSRRGGNLRVTLRDGRSFGVTVTKRGHDLDLALLRLEGGPGDLPVVRFGDSDVLRVGRLVRWWLRLKPKTRVQPPLNTRSATRGAGSGRPRAAS